jgi:hypothetical protein
MSYRFEAGRIYRMPTHFGPAPGPRQLPHEFLVDPKRSRSTLSVAASFLTDPAVLEQHLPEGFTLAGEAVVTVEFHYITDIDWLAGRGYTMINVGWPATFTGSRDRATANFSPLSGRILPIRSLRGVARLDSPSFMPRSLSHAGGAGSKAVRPAGWDFVFWSLRLLSYKRQLRSSEALLPMEL